jgi:hypothetical protein
MKDYTGIIILLSVVLTLSLASLQNSKSIERKGGTVERVWNEPVKNIFKTK